LRAFRAQKEQLEESLAHKEDLLNKEEAKCQAAKAENLNNAFKK
jgi:hypothetical protein